jgi:hypothetical protein
VRSPSRSAQGKHCLRARRSQGQHLQRVAAGCLRVLGLVLPGDLHRLEDGGGPVQRLPEGAEAEVGVRRRQPGLQKSTQGAMCSVADCIEASSERKAHASSACVNL